MWDLHPLKPVANSVFDLKQRQKKQKTSEQRKRVQTLFEIFSPSDLRRGVVTRHGKGEGGGGGMLYIIHLHTIAFATTRACIHTHKPTHTHTRTHTVAHKKQHTFFHTKTNTRNTEGSSSPRSVFLILIVFCCCVFDLILTTMGFFFFLELCGQLRSESIFATSYFGVQRGIKAYKKTGVARGFTVRRWAGSVLGRCRCGAVQHK